MFPLQKHPSLQTLPAPEGLRVRQLEPNETVMEADAEEPKGSDEQQARSIQRMPTGLGVFPLVGPR